MAERRLPSDFNFSPEGKFWEVNRENALAVFGGQRALLMQFAHPLVADPIQKNGSFRDDIITRAKHTIDGTLGMVFGTHEEARIAARRINQAHAGTSGILSEGVGIHPSGTQYRAMDSELLTWVWGTLADTALVVYDRFVRPLSDEEREEFYQESKGLLPLLGGKPSETPQTLEDFENYMKEMVQSGQVRVGPAAKELGRYAMLKHIPLLNLLGLPTSRIAVALLPEEIRRQYGYQLLPWEKPMLEKVSEASKAVHPHLPGIFRFTPKYRKALGTLG